MREIKAFNLSHWLGNVTRWCLCVPYERHGRSVQVFADSDSFHTCAYAVAVVTNAVCM